MTASALTLPAAARMIRDADPAAISAAAAELRETAIKDKTYTQTPIGRLVGRYLAELVFDNYSERTVENRENILAHLSMDLAQHSPADVKGRDPKAAAEQAFLPDAASDLELVTPPGSSCFLCERPAPHVVEDEHGNLGWACEGCLGLVERTGGLLVRTVRRAA